MQSFLRGGAKAMIEITIIFQSWSWSFGGRWTYQEFLGSTLHRPSGLVLGNGKGEQSVQQGPPAPWTLPLWKVGLCGGADTTPKTPHYCGVIEVMPSSHFIQVSSVHWKVKHLQWVFVRRKNPALTFLPIKSLPARPECQGNCLSAAACSRPDGNNADTSGSELPPPDVLQNLWQKRQLSTTGRPLQVDLGGVGQGGHFSGRRQSWAVSGREVEEVRWSLGSVASRADLQSCQNGRKCCSSLVALMPKRIQTSALK